MKEVVSKPIIHSREFAGREDITTLLITADCRKIEYKAFCDCSNLASVVIEDSNERIAIEFDAFKGCKSLVMLETQRPVYFFCDVNIKRRIHYGKRKGT